MSNGKLKPRLIPALLVKDMPQTLAFYRKLGFEVTGYAPNAAQPTWAEVSRDGVVLQFHAEAVQGTPAEPICSGTLYFFPESVEALAEEFRAKQVPFAWGPEVMDYGMREFGVKDPNGYFLAFAEPV